MTAQEYLKEQIAQLAIKFPFGKYSYEYDKFSGMHIIQVRPLSLYDLDNNYKDIETKLSIEFDNMFYPESVLFVSDNSLNQVSNPGFEKTGMFFDLQTIITHKTSPSFISIESEPFQAGESNYALAA